MSVIGSNILAGASGSAGAEIRYVDDVYSTWTYDGTSSTQTITNDIDLNGEGGLVWIKSREDATKNHQLYDTARGAGERLSSNLNSAEVDGSSNELTAFTSSGFTLGISSTVNSSSVGNYVSWSFRKAPGFFDVVTWTGNTTDTTVSRTISHSLGSAPGMIIAKRLDDTGDWQVYHRSLGNTKYLKLNSDARDSDTGGINRWRNTDPTSSDFTVGYTLNADTNTYVAYLFAHDDQSFGTNGDEAIIKCGSYTGTGSAGNFVDLGFEPQFLLIKQTNASRSWYLADNMRGIPTGGNTAYLLPDQNNAESTGAGNTINLHATGFELANHSALVNDTSASYAYMAIRRPHKPVEAGTDVFQALTFTGTSATEEKKDTNFPVDLMHTHRTAGGTPYFISRLQGNGRYINTSGTSTEGSGAGVTDFGPDYLKLDSSGPGADNGSAYINLYFRRAPGFLDVVSYDAASGDLTVNHNLGVTPEMVIVRGRNYTSAWTAWHSGLSAGTGSTNHHIRLNSDDAESSSANANFVSFSSTNFVVGDGRSSTNNTSVSGEYIAYLFASLDGISKVGSYDGTGSDVDVDCGFAAGARFVMIKRRDSTGDWYYWDTTRGIVSGNDPFMRFNLTTAATTDTDYIDPLNAGFTVTSSAPAALNASGGTYIFLAIA